MLSSLVCELLIIHKISQTFCIHGYRRTVSVDIVCLIKGMVMSLIMGKFRSGKNKKNLRSIKIPPVNVFLISPATSLSCTCGESSALTS